MIVFADSSAVVKLYADEHDHQVIRKQDVLLVSMLARVEVPAALWRKHLIGELGPADIGVLTAAFEADYHGSAEQTPRLSVIATTPTILEAAARLVGVHALRAYDAVQLATAKAAAHAVPDCRTMAAFDVTLRRAAAAEGFALLPAEPTNHQTAVAAT